MTSTENTVGMEAREAGRNAPENSLRIEARERLEAALLHVSGEHHVTFVSGPDLRAALASIAAADAALEEIIDLASLTVVGGDEFDRGVRAARLQAADIARAALSPTRRDGE